MVLFLLNSEEILKNVVIFGLENSSVSCDISEEIVKNAVILGWKIVLLLLNMSRF